MQEHQIREMVAILKFGKYCMTYDPPIIWRETIFPDYGFDGEIEFTQKGAQNLYVPTGQICKVVVKSVLNFDNKRLQFRNLGFYATYKSDILLIVYDANRDKLFAKKVSDIKIKPEQITQTIPFQDIDELIDGDKKLFDLFEVYKHDEEIPIDNKLIEKLLACPSGMQDWKSYENICISIVDFLFQGSFRNYHRVKQARNENGLDVKDLVIPNRSNNPFWNEVRIDYDSRNIVIEFKNYEDPIGKNQLLQISNYLKKKAYGRFGMVICRKGLSENGVKEQLELLRDDDKMVMVLSDEDVIDLIKQKDNGQNPEKFLEKLKTELELQI